MTTDYNHRQWSDSEGCDDSLFGNVAPSYIWKDWKFTKNLSQTHEHSHDSRTVLPGNKFAALVQHPHGNFEARLHRCVFKL